jgi:hypothetical protein
VFPIVNEVIPFIYKKSGKIYQIKRQEGRENRIVGLGSFYREMAYANAGDEIIIEKQEKEGYVNYYLDFNSYSNIVLARKDGKGFVVLNEDRLAMFQNIKTVFIMGEYKKINIKELSLSNLRNDSPSPSKKYNIEIDGISIASSFDRNDMLEMMLDNQNNIFLKRVSSWKKYVFEAGGI